MAERYLDDLDENGFVVIDGMFPLSDVSLLSAEYDRAVASADACDVKIGSRSDRINDFVNRGPFFDRVYVYPPVLEACRRVIASPFRLSTLHARTLRPHTTREELHEDFEADDLGWPMVGMILMVDGFTPDNGATRFVPGSHRRRSMTEGVEHLAVLACGPAGSVIVYNGSVLHGHSANVTDQPRRSLQGAYIRAGEPSGFDLPSRMTAGTIARLSPLSKQVLGI